MTDTIEAVARAIWEANKPYSDNCSWDILQAGMHLDEEMKDHIRGQARAALQALRDNESEAEIETMAFLLVLATCGVPPDVQELLVQGNPAMHVAPGALPKAIRAARKAILTEAMKEA